MMVPIVITAIVTLLIAVPVTALIASAQCKKGIEQKIGNADDKAREIIDEALKTAEAKKRRQRGKTIRLFSRIRHYKRYCIFWKSDIT